MPARPCSGAGNRRTPQRRAGAPQAAARRACRLRTRLSPVRGCAIGVCARRASLHTRSCRGGRHRHCTCHRAGPAFRRRCRPLLLSTHAGERPRANPRTHLRRVVAPLHLMARCLYRACHHRHAAAARRGHRSQRNPAYRTTSERRRPRHHNDFPPTARQPPLYGLRPVMWPRLRRYVRIHRRFAIRAARDLRLISPAVQRHFRYECPGAGDCQPDQRAARRSCAASSLAGRGINCHSDRWSCTALGRHYWWYWPCWHTAIAVCRCLQSRLRYA